jgi:signal transduction histidine kinase
MNVKHWSLDRLWTWLATGLVLALCVPSGLFLTYSASRSVEEHLTRKGQVFAKTLGTSVIESLLMNEPVRMHEILTDAIAADPSIGYACIADAQGKMIATSFTHGYPPGLLRLWLEHPGQIVRFSSGHDTWLDVSEPLLENQLGILHVGIARAEAIQASRTILVILALAVMGALILILIGTHLIGATVSRPLQQLQTVVSHYPQTTDIPPDLETLGTQEVTALTRGFRDMLTRLDHLEQERKTTQESLIQTERLTAVGELASGLAHEIRNPLDGMLECVHLLETDVTKSTMACKYYPMLKEGLERISRTMQAMLILARSGENVTVEPCRTRDILDELQVLVQPQVNDRQVKLLWEKVGPCFCLCDRHGLLQAGLNLIRNAVDAASEQGSQGQVTVRNFCDDRHVFLSVEDNGPGVPEDKRERIFDPFVSSKPVGKGTGLGLPVSRQLIRAVGGTLTLANKPSALGGALFLIRLPKHSEV